MRGSMRPRLSGVPVGEVSKTVLGGCNRDAHETRATILTLHFNHGALLLQLIREPNKPIATRKTRHRIRYNLGGTARGVMLRKRLKKQIIIDLWSKVANENGKFRPVIFSNAPQSVSKAYRK